MAFAQTTPALQAKNAGLKSLTTVSEVTGVSMQTLANWHKNKPLLFEVVILGVKARLSEKENKNIK